MIAGVDLGTSAIKVLIADEHKTVRKIRKVYKELCPEGWIGAMFAALSEITEAIDGISFSSQVGTYVAGDRVVHWYDGTGKDELTRIKRDIPKETFLSEISMPHPDICSYPMPRLLCLKEHGGIETVCQPKELLIETLTGRRVSDPYSWRGLTDLTAGTYSEAMLSYLGIGEEALPTLASPFSVAGRVTKSAAEKTGLREGLPVYVGCNDYYAGLVGMGIVKTGMLYDITGTSEHIGLTTDKIYPDTAMVSGPYFAGNVHYGVTAGSGKSLDFGIRTFDFNAIDIDEALRHKPPIFLPYVAGERAPIWDAKARGVFFGINADTTSADMAYSVLEGVAMSAYHIFRCLSPDEAYPCLITAGGAAKDEKFNSLKASLFGIPVVTMEESDTSALGAAMIGFIGEGAFSGIAEAANALCREKSRVEVTKRDVLSERFDLYRKLYPQNRELFQEFGRLYV